ncbi:MAG TPA: hypothetical protein VF263_24590, partial [Longimicrobiaceae bacterium]
MAELHPATLEGWYALHQAWTLDWSALRAMDSARRAELAAEAEALWDEPASPTDGWSASFRLVGG